MFLIRAFLIKEQIMQRRWTAVALGLALWAAGCGASPEARLAGKWKLDLASAAADAAKQKGGDDAMAAGMANMLGAMGMKLEIEFDFRRDGTAVISGGMFGQNKSGTARWKVLKSEGDTLTIELSGDKPQETAKLSVKFLDNDRIQVNPTEGSKTPMVLTRAKDAKAAK